ncbi:Diadenosine tetraphosphatase [Minicystis rosea]|nr:Diadenosine tetraphosphatase [Minicystis rosea]
MKYGILSDVHASLEALSAVLADARAAGVDRLVCLGDLVGYHADPEACVALLREHDVVAIAGNHDRVAAGLDQPDGFGEVARRAVLWTRDRLSEQSRAYLAALPITRIVDARFLIFHGALHPVPNPDLHLSSAARVKKSMQAFVYGPWGVRLAFFGHTHRSVVHEARGGEPWSWEGDSMALSEGSHHLVNPGSVGQPRDGDPRASYAIFDAGAGLVRFRRVPFDHEACFAKAVAAGLIDGQAPTSFGRRLGRGLAGLVRRLS